jgi:hypothetical protein
MTQMQVVLDEKLEALGAQSFTLTVAEARTLASPGEETMAIFRKMEKHVPVEGRVIGTFESTTSAKSKEGKDESTDLAW